MSIKPILFNTAMVRAILAGRKTQTRRKIPIPSYGYFMHEPPKVKPPYREGDMLWVRETWTKLWYVDASGYTHYDQPMYYYAADGTPDITLMDDDGFELDNQRIRWRPSIHMPKEAARIFLHAKDVHIERLWDMDEEAAISEGFEDSPAGTGSPLERFSTLWDKTIKRDDLRKYGYHANPWVWVIEFEQCEKPEGWCK